MLINWDKSVPQVPERSVNWKQCRVKCQVFQVTLYHTLQAQILSIAQLQWQLGDNCLLQSPPPHPPITFSNSNNGCGKINPCVKKQLHKRCGIYTAFVVTKETAAPAKSHPAMGETFRLPERNSKHVHYTKETSASKYIQTKQTLLPVGANFNRFPKHITQTWANG